MEHCFYCLGVGVVKPFFHIDTTLYVTCDRCEAGSYMNELLERECYEAESQNTEEQGTNALRRVRRRTPRASKSTVKRKPGPKERGSSRAEERAKISPKNEE